MIERFENDRIGLADAVEATRLALLPQLRSLESDLDTLATIQALNVPFPVLPQGMSALKKRIYQQVLIEKSRFFWREQTAMQLGTCLLRRIVTGLASPERMKMKSLLFVIPYDIVDGKTGGASRLFGLARELAQKFEVKMITLVGSRRDPDVISSYPGVTLYVVPRTMAFDKHVEELRNVYGDAADLLAMHTGVHMLPLLSYWIETVGSDAIAVIIDGPPLLGVVKKILPDTPVIYESPNIYQSFVEMLAGKETLQASAAVQLAEKLEADICKESRFVVCVSESDRAFMIANYSVPMNKTLVVPNGISTGECIYVPPYSTQRLKKYAGVSRTIALFIGALHKPNVEAVKFVMRDVAPRLSHVQFVVAGMSCSEISGVYPCKLPNNLTFTGKLSNSLKEALMAISDVALCPIVSGGGSSLKIPDYVAHGKPVVSTSFGVRGFDELVSSIAVVDLNSFHSSLVHVIESLRIRSAEMNQQCDRARAIVESRFDWSIIAGQLIDSIHCICREKNG